MQLDSKSLVIVTVAGAVIAAGTSWASQAATNSTPVASKTVEVRMTNEGGNVRYEPRDITIQQGDTIKWIVSGGSHNIKFWADSVPEGAIELLKKATTDSLETRRFPNAGDSFSIVFADIPKGTYKYYCRPHLNRGMTASITIE